MIEKSGSVTLTDEDLVAYYDGYISDRLKREWNITNLDDLHQLIKSNQYKLLTHSEKFDEYRKTV